MCKKLLFGMSKVQFEFPEILKANSAREFQRLWKSFGNLKKF